jgi:ferredoxin
MTLSKALKIAENEIKNLLNILNDSFQVFIPKLKEKTSYKFYEWDIYNNGDEFNIFIGVPKSSIKSFFFPQPETLFKFSIQKDTTALKEPEEENKRMLFGVRPCDARSIILNKLPYSEDSYYIKKTEQNIIIGLSCNERRNSCFCLWAGGSPMGTEGTDISLTLIDASFIVEAITERGGKIIETLGDKFPVASTSDIEKLNALRASYEKQRQSIPDPVKKIQDKNLLELYDKPLWNDVSLSCINCGICTFLCPTCYCFDIQDETSKGQGKRIRFWDSCMFPLFTQHATGHNPRGAKHQRVRNRFMHKLKYFPDRYNVFSCVGCGRCIKECPVNIDIREVLRDML